MVIVERIQRLSPPFQTEVLDFVEYLLTKAEREERTEWSDLSLAYAMRGMKDEEIPTYTIADLKVVFA